MGDEPTPAERPAARSAHEPRHGAATWIATLYDELREVAAIYCSRERRDNTLQPTALLHEVYLKLEKRVGLTWDHATQFRAVAATAMRQILVDSARARLTEKRGGGCVRTLLEPDDAIAETPEVDLLDLESALQELASLDERKFRVVELRFFGGLTSDQAAEALSIAPKTAEADWYVARAWLRKRLRDRSSRSEERPAGGECGRNSEKS